MPDDFERMWADLAPVGRSASSGGYFRQPFLTAERELAAWFEEQCLARGLTLERDGVGNVVGWWEPVGGVVVDELAQRPAQLLRRRAGFEAGAVDGGAVFGGGQGA